jgi:hypothetical protein
MCACADLGSYQILVHINFRLNSGKYKMYRINDLKKLKKDEIIQIAKSNGIVLNKNIRKSGILELLSKSGCFKSNNSNQSTSSHDSASVFEARDLRYTALAEDVFNELPPINYEGIYQYCCQDAYSFKLLARAHNHKDAGDIIDIKLCKVGMLTYYTHGLRMHNSVPD